jgi:hypothetical protein
VPVTELPFCSACISFGWYGCYGTVIRAEGRLPMVLMEDEGAIQGMHVDQPCPAGLHKLTKFLMQLHI